MSTTKEFREEALKLAETMGISSAAKELGITAAKLYGWRSAAKKKQSVSLRETELIPITLSKSPIALAI